MGHGVAQMVAQAGYNVYAIESQEKALESGIKRCDNMMSLVIYIFMHVCI